MSCESWQSKYKVPKGSRASKINEGDGKGIFCLDNNVDRRSADRLNLNNKISLNGFCDGNYPEGHPQGQGRGRGQLALEYIEKDKLKLQQILKHLCSQSNIQILNYNSNYSSHPKFGRGVESEIDLCKNRIKKYPIRSQQEIEYLRRTDPDYYKYEKKLKPTTQVFINGKVKNSKHWWENIANNLNML